MGTRVAPWWPPLLLVDWMLWPLTPGLRSLGQAGWLAGAGTLGCFWKGSAGGAKKLGGCWLTWAAD